MHKNILIVVGITILFLGTCINPSIAIDTIKKVSTPVSNGNTLYVGGTGEGNYTKIQDAIDNASDGDTVYVYDDSSPYKERLSIGKKINLIGENRDTTIIEVKSSYPAIYSYADNVVVSGFTIINFKYPYSDCGISISSSNSVFHNNKIMYFSRDGIYIDHDGENNIVTNNVILHNGYCGILCRESGNKIAWNVIGDNALGDYSNGLRVYRDGYYHHNDFYMNWRGNAHCFAGPQTWDDGSEGNFWDDWEYNPGYPDTYIISTEYGYGDAIDYHPSPKSYLNYTIVSIWPSYYRGVNDTVWFNPKINVEPSSISSWFWDFGDGNTSTEKEPWYSYSQQGIFNVSVTVIDNKGQSDTDISKAYIGNPPYTPSITGPTNCKPYRWYNYTIVAEDYDGGLLYYEIDWGDGYMENIGPYPAGEEINVSHQWGWIRTYWIWVIAIDEVGFESDWAILEVEVPRTRASSYLWFEWLFECFPLVERLLNLLLL